MKISDENISSVEKILNIIEGKGLSFILAIAFFIYIIFNNYTLTKEIQKYSEVMYSFTTILESINLKIDN